MYPGRSRSPSAKSLHERAARARAFEQQPKTLARAVAGAVERLVSEAGWGNLRQPSVEQADRRLHAAQDVGFIEAVEHGALWVTYCHGGSVDRHLDDFTAACARPTPVEEIGS